MANADLESFRAQWQEEISTRRNTTAVVETVPPNTSIEDAGKPSSSSSSRSGMPLRSHIKAPVHADIDENNALSLYQAAVLSEAQGLMDKAVNMYRKAFKLDPQIDRLYHNESLKPTATSEPIRKEQDLAYQFARTVHIGQDYSTKQNDNDKIHPSSTQGLLDVLLPSFRATPYIRQGQTEPVLPLDSIAFIQSTDLRPFHANKLPDELWVQILMELMLPNRISAYPRIDRLERFALVSRKARLLTLNPTLWKLAIQLLYTPPFQLPPETSALGLCRDVHRGDFRRMFIEQPRVRTDGCFISVVQYLRRGEADNVWVAPSHIVVYFRFVCFSFHYILYVFSQGKTNARCLFTF